MGDKNMPTLYHLVDLDNLLVQKILTRAMF